MKAIIIIICVFALTGCVSSTSDLTSKPTLSPDIKPQALNAISPHYPPELLEKSIEGWVDIEWVIDSTGKSTDIKVLNSSDTRFEQPSIEAIAQVIWAPGKQNNIPVATLVKQRITFAPD